MFKKNALGKVLFLAFLLRLLLAWTPGHSDIGNHIDWGIKFWEYGARNFYEKTIWAVSWPNQPVGSIFLFAVLAKINSYVFQFLWRANLLLPFFPSFIFPFLEKSLHVFLLKLPFILSDLGLGLLVYKIVKEETEKEKLSVLAASFFLFNPALIYNSAIWGQTDSLVNLLAFLSIWLAWKKKWFFSFLSFFGSLYFKMSLIIFCPIFLVLAWRDKKLFLRIGGALFLALSVFVLLFIPFVHHGNVFTWIWYLYTNRIFPRQGNMLTGNAFNLWALLFGIDLTKGAGTKILFFSARDIGMILFLGFILTSVIFVVRKKRIVFQDFLWLLSIFSFSAFLFMTNMHERYLYPVFPALAVLAILKPRLRPIFWLLSGIHLLNLYYLWWFPKIDFLVSAMTFASGFSARLFSLANIIIFGFLVKIFINDEKQEA